MDGPPASSRVLLRSGDPAPVAGIFTAFGDSIAALPGGGIGFTDGIRSTLFVRRAGVTTAIACAGQVSPSGSRFEEFFQVSAGDGGALAFVATLADGRTGVFRVPAGGIDPAGESAIESILVSGDEMALRDGPALVAGFDGIGVDGTGGVVAQTYFDSVAGALIAVGPSGSRSIIVEPGDPIGNALVAWLLPAPPGVNGAGSVAFLAVNDRGRQVVGTIAPGSSAAARFVASGGQASNDTSLLHSRPAINDRGDIAFLWMMGSNIQTTRVQRITAEGISMTVGRGGLPVPGGGSLRTVVQADPAIAGDGTVSFVAFRTDNAPGIYSAGPFGGLSTIVEGGDPGEDNTYWGIRYFSQPGLALGPDGTLLFQDDGFSGPAILSAAGGVVKAELQRGNPVGTTRFATFTSTAAQFMGGGPAVAPGGLVFLEARVTGGIRGLYARNRSGGIVPVAIGDVPHAGNSGFDDLFFSFHSINASGTYAFVGRANSPPSFQVGLYYGRLGEGPPQRLVDLGPAIPVSALGQRAGPTSYGPVPAPTRINAAGQVAVILDDPAGKALVCYDGHDLVRVVATGDAASDGGTFTSLSTGSQFLGREIAPVLDDAGRITFGAFTSRGDNALFRAGCVAGGGGVPARLVGAGDEVEGGRFSPFEVQNLDADAAGRILLEAIYNDDYAFGTFLQSGGTITPLARRFDMLPDGNFVFGVTPRLALAGPRGAAYGVSSFSGGEMILVRGPGPTDEPQVLAATGAPAPDGGTYVGIGGGQTGGLRRVETGRIGSDGQGVLVFVAATTEWPEILVIDGLSENAVPTADAGAGIIAECAGPEGASVTLDGSGSSDPDGDSLSWTWTGPFGTVEGASPTVTIPIGTWEIDLVVSDGQVSSEKDSVTVVVQDNAPPLMRVTPAPAVLWPPDRRMVPVSLDVLVRDLCDPAPSVALTGVASTEPGMGGGSQIADADLGTDDRAIRLQAARDGNGPGRIYLVTYRVVDQTGNSATRTMTVTVPHDQRPRP